MVNDLEITEGLSCDPVFSHEASTYEFFAHEESMHDDTTHDDTMQDDTTHDDMTHTFGHSDEWYPWRSRAVSRVSVSACAYNH